MVQGAAERRSGTTVPNQGGAFAEGDFSMSDDLDQTDGAGGKHAAARQLAEQALRAQAAGDEEEAERLFADAERADPQAVIAVLEEHRDDPVTAAAPSEPQDDAELAAESRTVGPGADAPSRAGVSGRGSGADTQGT